MVERRIEASASTTIAPGALLDHQHCPDCGHDLSGKMLAEVITCPECGNTRSPAELLPEAPPGLLRRLVRATLGSALVVGVPLAVLLLMVMSSV